MFRKFKGKPLWYKLWIASVAIAALYLFVKLFFGGLNRFDYFLTFYTNGSIVLDTFLYPVKTSDEKK